METRKNKEIQHEEPKKFLNFFSIVNISPSHSQCYSLTPNERISTQEFNEINVLLKAKEFSKKQKKKSFFHCK